MGIHFFVISPRIARAFHRQSVRSHPCIGACSQRSAAFSFLVNASHHDLSWRNRLLHHFSARTPSAFIRLSHNARRIISTVAFWLGKQTGNPENRKYFSVMIILDIFNIGTRILSGYSWKFRMLTMSMKFLICTSYIILVNIIIITRSKSPGHVQWIVIYPLLG